MRTVARWESQRGKYFLELQESDGLYFYSSYYGGGSLGSLIANDSAAIVLMEREVDANIYLPDKSKLPMGRVR